MELCWVSHFIFYYAKCHYAECRYAECRGALFNVSNILKSHTHSCSRLVLLQFMYSITATKSYCVCWSQWKWLTPTAYYATALITVTTGFMVLASTEVFKTCFNKLECLITPYWNVLPGTNSPTYWANILHNVKTGSIR